MISINHYHVSFEHVKVGCLGIFTIGVMWCLNRCDWVYRAERSECEMGEMGVNVRNMHDITAKW